MFHVMAAVAPKFSSVELDSHLVGHLERVHVLRSRRGKLHVSMKATHTHRKPLASLFTILPHEKQSGTRAELKSLLSRAATADEDRASRRFWTEMSASMIWFWQLARSCFTSRFNAGCRFADLEGGKGIILSRMTQTFQSTH